jgi:hypothetical protein
MLHPSLPEHGTNVRAVSLLLANGPACRRMNDAEVSKSFLLQRSLDLSAHGDNQTTAPEMFGDTPARSTFPPVHKLAVVWIDPYCT